VFSFWQWHILRCILHTYAVRGIDKVGGIDRFRDRSRECHHDISDIRMQFVVLKELK